MTTVTLTYMHHDVGDAGEEPVVYRVTIEREAEGLTRDQMLDAFEDLLRGAGFLCEKATLGFPGDEA